MKLQKFLDSFTNEDWSAFRKYSTSRISDKTDLFVLLQYCFEQYSMNVQKGISIDHICSELFPRKSRKTVLNMCSELNQVVKDFLIVDQLKEEYYERQILLLKALNKRRLYKQSDQLVTQIDHHLGGEPLGWFNNLYKNRIHHEHYFSNNPFQEKNDSTTFQKLIRSVKGFHDEVRALYFFETQNNLLLNKTSYKALVDDYNLDEESDNRIIQIFNDLHQVRINKNEECAQRLFNLLSKEHALLGNDLRLVIYIILRGYYAFLSNQGDLSFALKSFDLVCTMIDHNYLNYNKSISRNNFLNIVQLSCFLKKPKKGRSFITAHKNSLPLKDRKVTCQIAEAHMLFSEEKFEKVLDLLSLTYPKYILNKSLASRLELITYIELFPDDQYFLLSKLESYRLYIYRNKKHLSKRNYTATMNFNSIMKLFIKQKSLKVIQNKVQNKDLLIYRLYINSKLKKAPRKMQRAF